MKIGDKVRKRLTGTLCESNGRHSQPAVTGTVVWIHPQNRFYVAEFKLGHERIHECFEVPK